MAEVSLEAPYNLSGPACESGRTSWLTHLSMFWVLWLPRCGLAGAWRGADVGVGVGDLWEYSGTLGARNGPYIMMAQGLDHGAFGEPGDYCSGSIR